MPLVHGHKVRWSVDEAPCTVCLKEYDSSEVMVKDSTTDELLCRECFLEFTAEHRIFQRTYGVLVQGRWDAFPYFGESPSDRRKTTHEY